MTTIIIFYDRETAQYLVIRTTPPEVTPTITKGSWDDAMFHLSEAIPNRATANGLLSMLACARLDSFSFTYRTKEHPNDRII